MGFRYKGFRSERGPRISVTGDCCKLLLICWARPCASIELSRLVCRILNWLANVGAGLRSLLC